ncbi:hypothetical protein Tco_1196122, partial [Tanacetum coccineum]
MYPIGGSYVVIFGRVDQILASLPGNEENAYEPKGKFLDDLHNNAFSGTNEEDAVEHIEYFLRIVDPIDLPNVNQDILRVIVFPISLMMLESNSVNQTPVEVESSGREEEEEE